MARDDEDRRRESLFAQDGDDVMFEVLETIIERQCHVVSGRQRLDSGELRADDVGISLQQVHLAGKHRCLSGLDRMIHEGHECPRHLSSR